MIGKLFGKAGQTVDRLKHVCEKRYIPNRQLIVPHKKVVQMFNFFAMISGMLLVYSSSIDLLLSFQQVYHILIYSRSTGTFISGRVAVSTDRYPASSCEQTSLTPGSIWQHL